MTQNMINNQIIKDFYRKTKLIYRNDLKTIWEVFHIYTGNSAVVKIQSIVINPNQRNVLHQGKFLQSCQGSPGIPFLFWCGKDQTQKECLLIQQKLGKTLKQLIADSQSNTFSLKTVVMIGIQLLKIIFCYHEKRFIHKNINLDTIQFGVGQKCSRAYLNDFIESRSFYKKETLKHIDKRVGLKLKKATQFASFDTLNGMEASRKDDIESIILVLVFLAKGKLPWTDVWPNISSQKSDNFYSSKDQYIQLRNQQKKISRKNQARLYSQNSSSSFKQKTPENDFCEQKTLEILSDQSIKSWKLQKRIEITKKIRQMYTAKRLCSQLPVEFQQIYTEVRSLQFTEKPNYLIYILKLKSILIKNNWKNDQIYDWMHSKTLCKPVSKGGLSIKQYQWLINPRPNEPKLIEFEKQKQILKIYQQYAPFIDVDKLEGL